MKKITFIGAGSFDFTRELVRDILTYPAFRDARICLMDIDEERLLWSKRACEKLKAAGNYPAKIEATTDRKKALEGADGVVITVLTAGPEIFRTDVEIPARYGVDICVGDTRGPAGIFRFLRTAPVLLEICRDIERICPEAYVLNYTNPMALNCRYLQEMTNVKITGLCHSVQHTAKMLADWIGADIHDIDYTCAGINHQAFYIRYEWKGQDAYPLIRKAVERKEIYNEEQVRNQLFLHLGYYPTESSGHNSEYYPWFRKRLDLLEKYCTHSTGWNPGEHAYTKLHQRLGATIIYVTHDQTEAMTLGTRIVVMKDGVIQQIDSPQAIYNSPCNLFVAGFIGSPQMNFIDVRCEKDKESIYLNLNGTKLSLPKERAQMLWDKGYVGKTVVLGIRPEDVSDKNMTGAAVVRGKISVYELLGAEAYLYFELGGEQMIARVDADTSAKEGSEIDFYLNMGKVHLFDKETEVVIM